MIINHQSYIVYHTDGCCWELFDVIQVSITASMVFDVSTTLANGT